MANSTVNGQITDAVTQTNVKVVAESPAQAMGMLYQTAMQSNGMAMYNAVSNQQNLNLLNASIVGQATKLILSA